MAHMSCGHYNNTNTSAVDTSGVSEALLNKAKSQSIEFSGLGCRGLGV